MLRFEVPRVHHGQEAHLGDMFEILETSKTAYNLASYALSQTTLEQIFNSFASQQQEEKGAAVGLVTRQAVGPSDSTHTVNDRAQGPTRAVTFLNTTANSNTRDPESGDGSAID